jgi:hypothetical protein
MPVADDSAGRRETAACGTTADLGASASGPTWKTVPHWGHRIRATRA